jgi:hypothetical protein
MKRHSDEQPDLDPRQCLAKRRNTGFARPLTNPLQQIEAEYNDPPDDSKINLSDIPHDYGKAKNTRIRHNRIEVRWMRSANHAYFISPVCLPVILTEQQILQDESQGVRRRQMAGA